MENISIKNIRLIYTSNKKIFEKRLLSFKKLWKDGNDLDLFGELCYCICTSREKAVKAQNAINALMKNNILVKGNYDDIDKVLIENGIALHPQKAERIIKNREIFFPNTKNVLQIKYDFKDIIKTREDIINDVAGFGMKEASHFLRNIGFGDNIAILDRHIINQLIKYGIIEKIEKKKSGVSVTKKQYYEIEKLMIQFSKKIMIPMNILDMVLIYVENNEIMK